MPIFRNIFGCSSQDNQQQYDTQILDLKHRITRLEDSYQSVRDILQEIRLEMRLMRLELVNNNVIP